MKVLVLGSSGMAGHMIAKYLSSKGYTVATAGKNLSLHGQTYYIDVEAKETISFCVNKNFNYDYVINCIGCLIRDSAENFSRAIIVNSWFPHYLEDILADSKTRIVHLSTDCVFDGTKGNYVETDIPDEINNYGRSKMLGEINNHKDITFRMSIIGPEIREKTTGLLEYILNHKGDVIHGYINALWNGVTTLQLAKCIETYMLDPKISGIYHLVSNNNRINKHELLTMINEVYGLGKTVDIMRNKNVNKVLIDTRKEIDFEIPDYKTMLTELRDFN